MSLSANERPGTPAWSVPSAMPPEMNVTPMLDVLLVLLIIFMAALSSRMVIDAHIPDPNAHAQSEAVPIVLEVGANGVYAINRQAVPSRELATRLKALYAERPDKRIILQGARDAKYQEIIHAMDVARGAGVVVLGVEMRPDAASGAGSPLTARGRAVP